MNTKTLGKMTFAVVAMAALSIGQLSFGQVAKPPVRTVPGGPPSQVARPQAGPVTLEAAKDRMVTEIFKGQLGERSLFANPSVVKQGITIRGWRAPDEIRVQEESWFFFVDEMPGANWEHPAHYVLVNKATGATRAVPVKTPPGDLHTLRAMNPAAERQLQVIQRNRASVLDRVVVRPVVIPQKGKYAVLVSGGWDASHNYSRYWNDMSFMYKTLKQKYGYTDDEIIVLFANGTHSPSADLDGDGKDDIDYAATKANLTSVFNIIAGHLREDGKFFFYSTNHGGQGSGPQDAILYLWGEWIRDDELATLSKKIVAREALYVMEQCFSGGMMDNLLTAQPHPCNKPAVCVMTAAQSNEVSWGADTEGDYDEYIYHWTSAVNGRTPGGTPVNADTNGDGIVSMNEAHAYAKSHDSRNEHPVIGSCRVDACDPDLHAEVAFKDDCVSFNPATTTTGQVTGRWKVMDGGHLLFDFGSNSAEASRTLAIIKHYNMNQSCFVGRPNPSFQYMLISGNSPVGAMAGEDCVSFNPATTTVSNVGGTWKVVDGNHAMFNFGSNKPEADQTLEVIKKHGFTQSCFVGRPNPSFSYLRK
ncbi:MAG: C13 family peptidase [Acidobacteriia bacterium]|nr:C13 family peptidase [Terriglobia bacterium]